MKKQLLNYWLNEEKRVFQGWDFGSISKYMIEEKVPWDYEKYARKHMKSDIRVLDMGTGGGEFLLSLNPYPDLTFATEGYLPNYEYSKEHLNKYKIELRFVESDDRLPFEDNFFNLILNRHESFNSKEINRILKNDGIFITQQVGGKNNLDFASKLLGVIPNSINTLRDLKFEVDNLSECGFEILEKEEYYPCLKFTDIGAFVYFAKIIEWEFPDFSVEKQLDKLFELEEEVKLNGYIEMTEHRFFIMARKGNI